MNMNQINQDGKQSDSDSKSKRSQSRNQRNNKKVPRDQGHQNNPKTIHFSKKQLYAISFILLTINPSLSIYGPITYQAELTGASIVHQIVPINLASLIILRLDDKHLQFVELNKENREKVEVRRLPPKVSRKDQNKMVKILGLNFGLFLAQFPEKFEVTSYTQSTSPSNVIGAINGKGYDLKLGIVDITVDNLKRYIGVLLEEGIILIFQLPHEISRMTQYELKLVRSIVIAELNPRLISVTSQGLVTVVSKSREAPTLDQIVIYQINSEETYVDKNEQTRNKFSIFKKSSKLLSQVVKMLPLGSEAGNEILFLDQHKQIYRYIWQVREQKIIAEKGILLRFSPSGLMCIDFTFIARLGTPAILLTSDKGMHLLGYPDGAELFFESNPGLTSISTLSRNAQNMYILYSDFNPNKKAIEFKIRGLLQCQEKCSFCQDPSKNKNMEKCLRCSKDSVLGFQNENGEPRQCVSCKEDGQFRDGFECKLCHKSCRQCTGPLETECTACYDKIGLTNQNRCGCENPGEYVNQVTRECGRCKNSCKTCAGSSEFCTSCDLHSTQKLLIVDKGRCAAGCPDNTFKKIEPETYAIKCINCKEANGCTKCSDGVCKKCAEGFTLTKEGCRKITENPDECLQNIQNCVECVEEESGVRCSTCKPGYSLDKDHNCQVCDIEGCLECNEDMKCNKCDRNSATPWFFDGKCVSECPKSTQKITMLMSCMKNPSFGGFPRTIGNPAKDAQKIESPGGEETPKASADQSGGNEPTPTGKDIQAVDRPKDNYPHQAPGVQTGGKNQNGRGNGGQVVVGGSESPLQGSIDPAKGGNQNEDGNGNQGANDPPQAPGDQTDNNKQNDVGLPDRVEDTGPKEIPRAPGAPGGQRNNHIETPHENCDPELCEKCDPNSASSCVKCKIGSYLKFEGHSGLKKCEKCDQNCVECQAPAGKCTRCVDPMKLNDQFSCECPEGFFLLADSEVRSKCFKCSPSCQTCQRTSLACTSCHENMILDKEKLTCAPPLTKPEDCVKGEFFDADSKACLKCSGGCERCQDQADNCLECDKGSERPFFYGNSCHQECPRGTTQSPNDKICRECDAKCASCSVAPTVCLACSGLYEMVSYVGEEGNYQECVLKCQKDEYRDLGTKKCTKCSQNCYECTEKGECKICKEGFIMDKETKSCKALSLGGGFSVSPTGDRVECPDGCRSCKSANECQECSEGYSKTNGKCVLQCSEGTILQLDDKEKQFCENCQQGCLSCTKEPRNCMKCEEGYFLNQTNNCQMSCGVSEAWVHPNTCEQCNDCHKCLNVTKTCIDTIDFLIINPTKEKDIFSDIVFGLGLFVENEKGEKEPFNLKLIKKDNIHEDLISLTIEGAGGEEGSGDKQAPASSKSESLTTVIKWNEARSSLILAANLSEEAPKQLYKITSKLNRDQVIDHREGSGSGWIFYATHNSQELEYNFDFRVEKEKLEKSTAIGNTFSKTSGASETIFDYGSIIANLLSMDQSGAMLKFSQIIKMLSRMRLINIEFGAYLDNFMDMAANTFDKPSELSHNEFFTVSPHNYGKLSSKRVALSLTESRFTLPVTMYLVASVLSYIGWFILGIMRELRSISPFLLWLITKIRKISFVSFNMVVIDVMFYGVRTLLHSEGKSLESAFQLTIVCMVLNLVDILAIVQTYLVYYKGLASPIPEVQGKKNAKQGKNDKNSTIISNTSMSQLWKNDLASQRGDQSKKRAKHHHNQKLKHSYTNEEMMKIMTETEATNKGYKKMIDNHRTLAFHRLNEVVIQHAVAELRPDKMVLCRLVTIITNFMFLARMIMFQITIVSLPHSPYLQLFILTLVELVYFTMTLVNYYRFRHFKMLYLLLSKVFLSVFLLMFLGLCVKFSLNSDKETKSVPEDLQMMGVYLILISVAVDYLFLLIRCIVAIYLFFKRNRKGKSMNANGKGMIDNQHKIFWKFSVTIFHKWVRHRQVGEHGQGINGRDEADELLAKEIEETKKKQKHRAQRARAKQAKKRVEELEAIPAIGIFELSDYERELEKAKSESKKTDVSRGHRKKNSKSKHKEKGDRVKYRDIKGMPFKQFSKFKKELGRRIPNKGKKKSTRRNK